MNSVKSLSELHPKRLMSGLLDDDDAPAAAGTADSGDSGTSTGAPKKPAQTFDPDLPAESSLSLLTDVAVMRARLAVISVR